MLHLCLQVKQINIKITNNQPPVLYLAIRLSSYNKNTSSSHQEYTQLQGLALIWIPFKHAFDIQMFSQNQFKLEQNSGLFRWSSDREAEKIIWIPNTIQMKVKILTIPQVPLDNLNINMIETVGNWNPDESKFLTVKRSWIANGTDFKQDLKCRSPTNW